MGGSVATMIAASVILPGQRVVLIHGRIQCRIHMVFIAMTGMRPRHAAQEREDQKPGCQQAFEYHRGRYLCSGGKDNLSFTQNQVSLFSCIANRYGERYGRYKS